MPIEPIKIPQNVYIEDRIVGPLTLKQVLICALGGGFSYAMFASISKTYGSIALPLQLLVWLPAAISAIFAFVRINDLSMMRLCLLLLERINKPATRTWTPRRGIIINVRTFHTVKEDKEAPHGPAAEKKIEKFEELSTVLDRQGQITTSPAAPTPTMDDLSPMNDEPMDDNEVDLMNDNPNVIRRPVDPQRISVSAVSGTPVDGVAPRNGSVSIFRDISPA